MGCKDHPGHNGCRRYVLNCQGARSGVDPGNGVLALGKIRAASIISESRIRKSAKI